MIDRALAIDGWMQPEELRWLAEQATTHKRIAELGSYMGRSTRALGDNTEGIVYAYDDWYGPREYEFTDEYRKTIWPKFQTNLKDLLESGKVIVRKINHADLTDAPMVDMVFIDGDHSYESVKRDIEFWRRYLIAGGLLCGHDLDQVQIKKAVIDCLGDVNNPIGYIWAVCL